MTITVTTPEATEITVETAGASAGNIAAVIPTAFATVLDPIVGTEHALSLDGTALKKVTYDDIKAFSLSGLTLAWGSVTGKPSTFPPIIGSGAGDAVAGNDARLTDARTPTSHTHTTADITDLTGEIIQWVPKNNESFVAQKGIFYVTTGTLTVSEHSSPEDGKGFTVMVRSGTTIIDSVPYDVAGTIIRRVYFGGSWQTYIYKDVDQLPVDLASAITAAIPKTTLVDADVVPITDSAASHGLKKATLTSLWTWITTKLGALTSLNAGGAWAFTSTTRPTSSGTGLPGPTNLITLADADNRIIGTAWRSWPFTGGGPSGCVVMDSTNTAAAISITNYTSAAYPLPILSCAGDSRSQMSFDRRHRIAFDFFISNATGAGVGWIVFGETFNQSAVNDPSKKGFGLKITSSGVSLWVHNGTTLNVAAATSIASTDTLYFLALEYWNGTLSGTVNGVAIASAASGPSGLSAANDTAVSYQVKTGATNERCRFGVMFPKSITTAS